LIRLFVAILFFLFQQSAIAAICTSETSDGKLLLPDDRVNQAYHGEEVVILVNCDNRGAAESQDFYLRFHYPVLDSIKIYAINADGTSTFLEDIGDWVPANRRTTNVRKPTFKLAVSSHSITRFKVAVSSAGSLQLSHELLPANEFIKVVEREAFILAIYYGIVFALIGYNLFLFVQTRRVVFGLYVLYLFTYVVFMANMDGISHLYLWNDHVWWSNFSTNIIIPIFLAFMLWFSGQFLRVGANSEKIFKTCLYLGIAMTAYAALAFFLPYRTTSIIGALLSVFTIFLLIALGLWTSIKHAIARYYTVAWSCLFLGMLIIVMRNLGIVPGSTLADYAMHIGSGSEAILLSLGLGSYIRSVEKEKLLFEKKAGSLTIASNSMQNLAHDIKNQLAVFELMSRVKTWEEHLEWTPTMSRAIERVHAIVDEFKGDLEDVPLRIRQDFLDIASIAAEANWTFGSENSAILAESETDSYQIMIDKISLERSILNLVTNAIEAGAHQVTIKSETTDSTLLLSVIDDGPGVPDSMQSNLFQRGNSFGKTGGQGIGLFNVRTIVAGHGGTIRYRRENGLSYFEMVLPNLISTDSKTAAEDEVVTNTYVYSTQRSVLISVSRIDRQEAVCAALANYPLKIYFHDSEEIRPSLVFTDCHKQMDRYLVMGVPIVMENGKDDPNKIAKQIIRRLLGQYHVKKSRTDHL
jgi:signal transduction histidine kinase